MKEDDVNYLLIAFYLMTLLAIVSFGMSVHIDTEKNLYKNKLIEFKHARYIIDEKTGICNFVIDEPSK